MVDFGIGRLCRFWAVQIQQPPTTLANRQSEVDTEGWGDAVLENAGGEMEEALLLGPLKALGGL